MHLLKIIVLFFFLIVETLALAQSNEAQYHEWWKQDQYEEILEASKGAKTNKLSTDVLYYIGYAYYLRTDYKSSLKYMLKAAEKGPTNSHIHYYLAIDNFYLDDRGAALNNINLAIELEPQSSFLHKEKGLILATYNMLNEAIVSYKTATAISAPNEDAFIMLADIYYYDLQQNDSALAVYYKALDWLQPGTDKQLYTLHKIIEIEQQKGNHVAAADVCLAYQKNATNSSVHLVTARLIQSYFALKDYKKARPQIKSLHHTFEEGKLPTELLNGFVLEQFTWNNLQVEGIERFATDTLQRTARHVYSISNASGELLYTLETEAINRPDPAQMKYVLVQKFPQKDESTPLPYTYPHPMDYEALHQNVMDVLTQQ